ncbi:MAG: hypothetical protein R3A11_09350 [Bdellovibrionota bacterium]
MFKFFGLICLLMLVAVLVLSAYALFGKVSKDRIFLVSTTVLGLMAGLTVLCSIIALSYQS